MNEPTQSFQLLSNSEHHPRAISCALGTLLLIMISGGIGFLLGKQTSPMTNTMSTQQKHQQAVIPAPVTSQAPISIISSTITATQLPSPTTLRGNWFVYISADILSKHSPAQLLITDAMGKQTGYNAGRNDYIQDIYGTTFCICQGISDPSGSGMAMQDVPTFEDDAPMTGIYKIEVLGLSSGAYRLHFSTTMGGPFSQSEIRGMASPGSLDIYRVICTTICSPPTKI